MNYKKIGNIAIAATASILLAACANENKEVTTSSNVVQSSSVSADTSNATNIDLSKESGDTVEITKAGTYVLSGTYDGQIHINAKDAKVNIILKNAEITAKKGPAIYAEDAKLTTISLEGTNKLVDTKDYDTAEEAPNATIYSKNDLTLTGNGSLEVNANYKAAIRSKDIVSIESGTYKIKSVTDSIKATDQVNISGGKIDINSGSDGIQATSTKDGKGIVTVNAGEINISAEKKGIKSAKVINIEGGKLNVSKSYEALESEVINIKGGENTLVASDDGINATSSDDTSSSTDKEMPGQGGGGPGAESADDNLIINITGGKTTVKAKGDGLDSNGNISMSDGELYVEQSGGGNAPLDYDGKFTQLGGTLMAMGSSDMAQTTEGSQYGLAIYDSESTSGKITFENGSEKLTYTPENNYDFIFISTPTMKKDGKVKVNDKEYTLTDTITTSGEAKNAGPGGGGPMGGDRPF